jgi:hypothetical protein
MFHSVAAPRIKGLVPQARFVIVLRVRATLINFLAAALLLRYCKCSCLVPSAVIETLVLPASITTLQVVQEWQVNIK